MKSLVIVYSYHHNNTEKIARSMAKALDAPVKTPDEVNQEEIAGYDLVGFGSGIYSGMHYESVLALAERLPLVNSGKVFIFSTAAIIGESKTTKDHARLREILKSRGYTILDEFSCKGFNTNSFLKFFGGMNKGRPNEEDIRNAEQFAERLKEKCTVEE